jgi:hypothetical protein
MTSLETENLLLKQEIETLKTELEQTKEHLKKYTAPKRRKTYYENHKEELKEKSKNQIITPEKKREYNKRYMEKKKQDKQK